MSLNSESKQVFPIHKVFIFDILLQWEKELLTQTSIVNSEKTLFFWRYQFYVFKIFINYNIKETCQQKESHVEINSEVFF